MFYCISNVSADCDCATKHTTVLVSVIEDIRLVDGNTPMDGRVEVLIHGVWGTVCDDRTNRHFSKVVCRMLRLST